MNTNRKKAVVVLIAFLPDMKEHQISKFDKYSQVKVRSRPLQIVFQSLETSSLVVQAFCTLPKTRTDIPVALEFPSPQILSNISLLS